MAGPFRSFVGIDWSGAAGRRQRGIAVALADASGETRLIEPPAGRWSRAEVLDWVAGLPDGTLVGLDFAFSLPWTEGEGFPWPAPGGPGTARDLWTEIERLCEHAPDLYAGPLYRPRGGYFAPLMFTKLTGEPTWRGALYDPSRLRRTERASSGTPNTVFKIVGANTVGPASFTGMRLLSRLSDRLGERVWTWPFDPPRAGGVTVCEIYPSDFFREVGQSRSAGPEGVKAALSSFSAHLVGRDPASPDEADAIVAAAGMRAVAGAAGLPAIDDPVVRREGWILGVPHP